MATIDEIKNMTDQEIAALNKKLAVRLVLTRIVAPIAITAVVHVGVNLLVKKLEKKNQS